MDRIETHRLFLRSLAEQDLPIFTAYRRDPEVARYQGWTPSFTLEMARELLNGQKGNFGSVDSWHQIAIVDKITNEIFGDCVIHFVDCGPDDNQTKIGFTLAGEHQGKGICTEAIRALLEYLFKTLKVRRITATVDVLNAKCVAVLERLNFRREAHYVENIWFKGAWGSEYMYALLSKEYFEQQNK